MGIVKITGKVIEYTGAVIANSDLESWLEDKISSYADERVKKLATNNVDRLLGKKKIRKAALEKIKPLFQNQYFTAFFESETKLLTTQLLQAASELPATRTQASLMNCLMAYPISLIEQNLTDLISDKVTTNPNLSHLLEESFGRKQATNFQQMLLEFWVDDVLDAITAMPSITKESAETANRYLVDCADYPSYSRDCYVVGHSLDLTWRKSSRTHGQLYLLAVGAFSKKRSIGAEIKNKNVTGAMEELNAKLFSTNLEELESEFAAFSADEDANVETVAKASVQFNTLNGLTESLAKKSPR